MKNVSIFALLAALATLTACGNEELDLAGKWGYRERMAAQNPQAAKPATVSMKTEDQTMAQPAPQATGPVLKDTVPCETTLSADGCGASPHGQRAAEIPVNQ